MENNLYQIEIQKDEVKQTGYILTKGENYLGILYTNIPGEFSYIYGKYVYNSKIDVNDSGEYNFLTMKSARDGSAYEEFILPNDCNTKIRLIKYDLSKGFEPARFMDISDFVDLQFSKHIVQDEVFADSYHLFLGEKENFQKTKEMSVPEYLPF